MNTFVDTCFLMQETGRQYLRTTRMRFSVIYSVQRELEKLSGAVQPCYEALMAKAFLSEVREQVNLLPELPEERDIRKSLVEESPLQADAAFRNIAIRCADEQTPVHFLTADFALAEVLGSYAEKITFLDRLNKQVHDWREIRASRVVDAQHELAGILADSDMVLTSSALCSPYLHQFLLNIQAVAPAKDRLPLLPGIAFQNVNEFHHLSWATEDLLENAELVRNVCCETYYPSEPAFLDALFYARASGRRVTVVVSGWDDVVQRYDARTAAFQHQTDAVNFRVITPAGGLTPLLNLWRLRKFFDLNEAHFPKAPAQEDSFISSPEAQLPPETAQPESESASMDEIVQLEGTSLALLVKSDQNEAVHEIAEKSRNHRALAILYSCRWGKPTLLASLLERAEELPGYCFNHWFKRSQKAQRIVPIEELLLNDAYYECLRCVVQNTKDFQEQSASITVLQAFARGAGECLPQRARAVLEMLRARGVNVAVYPAAKKGKKPDGPLSFSKAAYKYNSQLYPMVVEMKAAEFTEAIATIARPVDIPIVRVLGILAARRYDRPATIQALLKQCDVLPASCFEHWFARIKGSEDSPRARDLMLRKSFFDLGRRIIRMSDDLSSCDAALQTLQNLMRDEDETVRARAGEMMMLAEGKGACLFKKGKQSEAASPEPMEEVAAGE